MKMKWGRGWQGVVVLLATAALGSAKPTDMPSPGTLNFVEGQVSINGQPVSPKSAGSTMLEANQTLGTSKGNAELLLTPGVFLRLGNNSQVRMLSPGLADTRIQLVNGSAMLEVDELFKENDLGVKVDDATTRIEKTGLYDFNADHPSVAVLDGKATVLEGDRSLSLKKGHQVSLSDPLPLHTQKLDKNSVETDPLYRWSKLRSEYAAEANVDAARTVTVNGGWYGSGWYWDPYWSSYAFVPGSGIFYSPFGWGWGFYSPGWIGYAPYYRLGHYGWGYHHYPVVVGHGYRTERPLAAPHASMGGFHGGFHGGSGRR